MKRTVLLAIILAVGLAAADIGIQKSEELIETAAARTAVPNLARIVALQMEQPIEVFDRHGEKIATIGKSHATVERKRIPEHVQQAFLAVEDRRFYRHDGVDLHRVLGAARNNLLAGEYREGFSTITMQLARNLFPDEIPAHERTIWRKLTEMRTAWEIEKQWSKNEILELYLNRIYFGHGARGIAAAAELYFDRPVEKLSLAQGALLAAVIKAPSTYDPLRHPERARKRRNLVLHLMREQQRAGIRETFAAAEDPLVPPGREVEEPIAPYFVREVRRRLEQELGSGIYSLGLRVHTTLDRGMQEKAAGQMRAHLDRIEKGEIIALAQPASEDGDNGAGEPSDPLQGAFVMMDARNGDVLAWVGGRHFSKSQFDRVADGHRQLGSAFKPFVYATALRKGYPTSHRIDDDPLRIAVDRDDVWTPRNYGGRHGEPVGMREALVRSKNIPTVRLARDVGFARVAGFARRSGLAAEGRHPSIALGAVEATPLQVAEAYTPFATLGHRTDARLVLRVENAGGEVLWEPAPRARQVMGASTAYLITDMLQDVVDRGTGTAVRRAELAGSVAGKTGTTSDNHDAWFAGYTKDFVAVAWVGYDHPRSIGEKATGGRLAAPLWGQIMAGVYAEHPAPPPWRVPAGVVRRPIDPESGRPLRAGCEPNGGEPQSELLLTRAVAPEVCPRAPGQPVRDEVRQWIHRTLLRDTPAQYPRHRF